MLWKFKSKIVSNETAQNVLLFSRKVVYCWELAFFLTCDTYPSWILLPKWLLEAYNQFIHGSPTEHINAFLVLFWKIRYEFNFIGFENTQW